MNVRPVATPKPVPSMMTTAAIAGKSSVSEADSVRTSSGMFNVNADCSSTVTERTSCFQRVACWREVRRICRSSAIVAVVRNAHSFILGGSLAGVTDSFTPVASYRDLQIYGVLRGADDKIVTGPPHALSNRGPSHDTVVRATVAFASTGDSTMPAH